MSVELQSLKELNQSLETIARYLEVLEQDLEQLARNYQAHAQIQGRWSAFLLQTPPGGIS